MLKTLFAKYNRERLPQFQTVTSIVECNDGSCKAIKQALTPDAQRHIAEIYANYARLTAKYPQIKLVEPTLVNDSTVTFPMVKGFSLESLLKQALDKQDKSTFFALLDKFVAYVDSFVTKRQVKFEACDRFKQVFGEWTLDEPQDVIEIANVDLIFVNLFVLEDGSITQIDYEWVFDFAIPRSVLLWRALFALYSTNHDCRNLVALPELLDCAKIKLHELYSGFDSGFLNYVHGSGRRYFHNHRVLRSQQEPIDSRITKYPESSFMQLFYYQNNEINVENSQKIYLVDESQTKFSFELSGLSNLTHIRLDITNFPVISKIKSVGIILNNGDKQMVTPCYSNANLVDGNIYTYLHDDPNNLYYLTPLNLVEITGVEIEVDLQAIKKSEILDIANHVTSKSNEQFIKTQNELTQATNELRSMRSSKSWKITRPLRKLCSIFK